MSIPDHIFEKFPVLRTDRLTLRDLREGDARRIFDMRASGRMNTFIARENMNDPARSIELVDGCVKAFNERSGIAWAGILREGNEIIGTCGYNRIDHENRRAELGGELAPEYWGKGIALEAVRAIVEFGLGPMRLHSIEAWVEPGNRGAILLLEHLGFVKEAHYRDRIYFRGEYRDMAVYSCVAPI